MEDSNFRRRFPRRGQLSEGQSPREKKRAQFLGGETFSSPSSSHSSSGDEGEEEEEEESSRESWKKRPKEYVEKMKLWGNRMNRSAMVPPVTRTYEPIENYVIVEDEERVRAKMAVIPPLKSTEAPGKRGKVRARLEEKLVSDSLTLPIFILVLVLSTLPSFPS